MSKNKTIRVTTHFPKVISIILIILLTLISILTLLIMIVDFMGLAKIKIAEWELKDIIIYPWFSCTCLFFIIITIGLIVQRLPNKKTFIAGGIDIMYRMISAGTVILSICAVLWTISYIKDTSKIIEFWVSICISISYLFSYILMFYSIYINKKTVEKNGKVMNSLILAMKDIATNANDKETINKIYDMYNDIARIEKDKVIPPTDLKVKTSDTTVVTPEEAKDEIKK